MLVGIRNTRVSVVNLPTMLAHSTRLETLDEADQDDTISARISATNMSPSARWIGLVVFVVVCLGAGGLGAVATTPEIDNWYQTLSKPSWNPPDSVFGPVWTTLYIMMGIAAWLVWQPRGVRDAAVPLALFGLQLVLNVAWSWIFFGWHQPGWAFVEIVVLWLAIATTILAFESRSKTAAWLLVPYLAWVSFASVLNFAIWRMNAT